MRDTLATSTVKSHGLTFEVSIEQDEDSHEPWKECDGFGPVREIRRGYYDRHFSKKPGERILHDGGDRNTSWAYDWAGATALAKRDGWGISPEDRPTDWNSLNAAQQHVLAVQRDFDFIKAWCDDEWVWCGVCVALMIEGEDDEPAAYDGPLDLRDSLWSVEYWQYENFDSVKNTYAKSVATEIIDSIAKTYFTEQAERLACEERDIVTVAA